MQNAEDSQMTKTVLPPVLGADLIGDKHVKTSNKKGLWVLWQKYV